MQQSGLNGQHSSVLVAAACIPYLLDILADCVGIMVSVGGV